MSPDEARAPGGESMAPSSLPDSFVGAPVQRSSSPGQFDEW